MKIIDCFAAGLPVISTSKGIEGIPAIPGREALISDDWDALSAFIQQVHEDQDLAEQLKSGGRSIAEKLDWAAIAADYTRLFAAL